MRRHTFVLAGAISAIAACQYGTGQVWVGSTGMPTNQSQVTLSGGAAYVRSSLVSGTAVLHYNVLPVGDLTDILVTPGQLTGCRQMIVRYLDNGPNARVTIDLKQMNVSTGAITTLQSFDSDTQPVTSATSFQLGSSTCSTFDFDFAGGEDNVGSSAYYFEVKLQKSGSGGIAGIKEFHLVAFFF